MDYPIRNSTHYLLAKLTVHYSRKSGFDESSRLNIASIEQACQYVGFSRAVSSDVGQYGWECPRNVISSTATNVADPATDPRWGTVDKHKIVDEGRRRAF